MDWYLQQSEYILSVTKANYTTFHTYSLHLLQDRMLDVNVFKDSFNNHVGFFKATVIQLASQIGQYGVSLKWRDGPLFGLVIEPCLK